jgi:hypothetical protein
MIASALRAEIQQFIVSDRDGLVTGDLARLALTMLANSTDSHGPAALLACQAFCESLVAHVGGLSLDRFEATLDAIDDLVQDPAQLPMLRDRLRLFIEQVERRSQEVQSGAPRRQPALHVSAA